MPIVNLRGLGGGGAMFAPQVSPWLARPDLLFVACDMSGLYRSPDFGATWELLDTRIVRSWTTYYAALGRNTAFSVAFHPSTTGFVVAYHPATGLRKSLSDGADGTWVPFDLALPMTGGFAPGVSAATFTRDGRYFLVGTPAGLYRGDTTAPVAGFTLIPAAAGAVSLGNIFTFVTPTNLECFATNGVNVFRSTDAGTNWTVLPDPQPGRPVESIAGANDGTNIVLYASVRTDFTAVGFVGGVWRMQLTPGQPAPAAWTDVTANLHTDPQQANETRSTYRILGVAEQQGPNVVYVTAITGQHYDFPGPTWAVYKGQPAGSTLNWTGVYDGYQTHGGSANPPTPRYVNVEPGWIDEREHRDTPPGLGWGFGGPASGFTVDPKNAQRAVYTNFGMVDTTADGGASWQQKYSRFVNPAPPPLPQDERWMTTGLNVTTTWRYFCHPTNRQIHFICYTDIGFARSENGGETWRSITPRRGANDIWANFYDLAFESGPGSAGRIWAAVSNEHDIPHDKQIDEARTQIGVGDILVSTNNGADWTSYGTAGLAAGPVVSLYFRVEAGQGVLYASVWGSGVYRSVVPAVGTAPGWSRVGDLMAGPNGVPATRPGTMTPTHPHCARIDFDAAGTLYCLVAADRTVGLTAGGLYSIVNPATAGTGVAWTKHSLGLDTIAEYVGRVVAPIDFACDPAGGGAVYLATASFPGTNGGGGLYRRDTNGNWSKVQVPFEAAGNNYNNGVQAFGAFFVGSVLFATSTSHGVWWRSPSQPLQWREYNVLPFLRAQRITTTIDTSTGTIDPVDGDASLWFGTFGGGAFEVERRCTLITDHNTISREEVNAALTAGNGRVPRVAYLELDGFLGEEVGLLTTADVPQVTVTVNGAPSPDVTAVCQPPQHDVPDMNTPHRMTSICDLVFTGTGVFANPTLQLEFRQGPYVCRAAVALILPPHPYLLDGPVPWLSQDVQVFAVKENDSPYDNVQLVRTAAGAQNDAAAVGQALTYLTSLLASFNGGSTTFDAIAAGTVAVRPIQIWQLENNSATADRIFNFVVAKVHYRGTVAAADVRVFFRLCSAAAASFTYDATYRDDRPLGAPTPRVPLLGLKPSGSPPINEIVTIPCFATARVETDQSVPGALSMRAQPDDVPNVQQMLASTGAAETIRYFGCLLDLNQLKQRFALNPPASQEDGPWTGTPQNPLQSVQDLIRGRHQCLTAEVHYSFQNGPDSLRSGDTPGSSDCFSQRNLVILGSDNPGGGASHTVQHTFEVRGARLTLGVPTQGGAGPGDESEPGARGRPPHDELLIWWNDLPTAARATIAFNGLAVDDILALDARRSGSPRLERVDASTIQCAVGRLTYVPLPTLKDDVPALLTITLPDTVHYGQQFSVLVQQAGGPERAILGAFEISVRIQRPVRLLGDEENTLAVLRYTQERLPARDRWSPIIKRYVTQLAEKVDALGGNAATIPPSPRGAPAHGCWFWLWEFLRRVFGL